MIPVTGEGEFHEEVEVLGGADEPFMSDIGGLLPIALQIWLVSNAWQPESDLWK